MEWWQAMVLGLVEGLTEYLPVSSTGHLILAQAAMGVGRGSDVARSAADNYAICIQAGAILAVLGLFRRRCTSLVAGLVGRDPGGLRLATKLGIAFVPFGAAAFWLEEWIQRELFGIWPVVWAWLIGGLVILAAVRWRNGSAPEPGRGIDDLAWRHALIIGLFQCLALWPGTSRSLATILGGLAVGMGARAAAEFSFLLGGLTLLVATGFVIVRDGGSMLSAYSLSAMGLGFACALLSALAAVRGFMRYLEGHSLAVFGYYRIALACAVALLMWCGILDGVRS